MVELELQQKEITVKAILDDQDLLTQIIFESLSSGKPKRVKNILGWITRHYQIKLDTHEKQQLEMKIIFRLRELIITEKIKKEENKYKLCNFGKLI